MSVAADFTVKERLVEIGKGYRVFLKQSELRDEVLARMTYLAAAKKEYLEDPLDSDEDQIELIHHLTEWMAETLREMKEVMPATPDSMVLHVARAQPIHL